MPKDNTYVGEVTGMKIVERAGAQELGRGGMGVVRLGESDSGPIAIKTIRQKDSTPECKQRLIRNIKSGSPHPDLKWIKDLVVDQSGCLKLAMECFPSHYLQTTAIADPDAGSGVDVSLRTLTRICYNLADLMSAVQARGFCYGDPSTNQYHADVATGHLVGCDCDNAFVDDGSVESYLGTPCFMTPRLGLRRERVTRSTDTFAVAVCLFKLHTLSFPLLGKRKHDIRILGNADWMRLLYTDPLFVYDPVWKSNRPVSGLDDCLIKGWQRLPLRIRELFCQVFTRGLLDPNGRGNVAQWRYEFKRLHDEIFRCRICGAEVYFDKEAGSKQRCWNCDNTLETPSCLRLRDGAVILSKQTELYRHHVHRLGKADFSLAGRVVVDKARSDWVGLKNLSNDVWRVRSQNHSGAEIRTVRPGESVRLTKHAKFFFPGGTAKVGDP